MEKKNRLINTLVICCFFAATLCYFGPMKLYLNNVSEFWFVFKTIFKPILIVTLVLFFILTVVAMLLPQRAYDKYVTIVFALGCALWIQGTFLVWKYPLLDGSEINWSDFRFEQCFDTIIWIVVIFVICKFFKRKRHDAMVYIALIITFMQVIDYLYIYTYVSCGNENMQVQTVTDYRKEFKMSSGSNVVIFVLDTYRSDIFQDIINQDRELEADLKDFVYFDNATGAYNKTQMAIPFLLSSQAYDNTETCKAYKDRINNGKSIMNVLKDAGYLIHRYSFCDAELFGETYRDNEMIMGKKNQVDQMARSLYKLTLFRYLPSSLKPLFVVNYDEFLEVEKRDYYTIYDGAFYEDLLGHKVDVDTEQGVFKFYHLLGIHEPLGKEWGNRLSDTKDQNELAREIGKIDMEMLQEYIKQLKEQGIYDNTLLIVVGDHGCPNYETFGKEMPDILDKNFDEVCEYIINSARPLVLVKRINANNEVLVTNHAPITLGDIPITICEELNLKNDFQGKSIFKVGVNEERERLFKFYVWKEWEEGYLPKTKEYSINGNVADKNAWKETGRIFEHGETTKP